MTDYQYRLNLTLLTYDTATFKRYPHGEDEGQPPLLALDVADWKAMGRPGTIALVATAADEVNTP